MNCNLDYKGGDPSGVVDLPDTAYALISHLGKAYDSLLGSFGFFFLPIFAASATATATDLNLALGKNDAVDCVSSIPE